jgi:hypothetical protein
MGKGATTISFFKPEKQSPRRNQIHPNNPSTPSFSNPNAATNMTMIAKVEGLSISDYRLEVYVGDELAAAAEPMDSLYFITIQSDQVGELRFECNGERLAVNGERISYKANAHYGTIKAPVVLTTQDSILNTYKIIENNHVVIIRNNEKYDITGKKL